MSLDSAAAPRRDDTRLRDRATGDALLLEQAARGDVRAFEKIVRKYEEAVLSLALQLGRTPAEAEGVFDEVFAALAGGIAEVPVGTALDRWLLRRTFERVEALGARPSRADESGDDLVHVEVDGDGDEDGTGARALESLPPKQRAALVLKVHHGLDYQAIGQILGVAPIQTLLWIQQALIDMARER